MFMNINHLFVRATDVKAKKTTPDFTCFVGNHKYYSHTHVPAAQQSTTGEKCTHR